MRPGEVLDAKMDLMDRLDDAVFRRVVDALGDFEFGRSGGRREGNNLSEILGNGLHLADAFRVTHDMSLMVQHVAGLLDDIDQFHSDLAPADVGFVCFDRPLPMNDMRGKTMLIHYLIWAPIGVHVVTATGLSPATLAVMFNDRWREPDEVDPDMWENLDGRLPDDIERLRHTLGRWATVGSSAYFDGQRTGPPLMMPSEEYQAKILADGDMPHPGTNAMRYLHALWLLMGQTVAKVEEEGADRPARRRAKRKRIPDKVTVVRLRREDGERQEGETEVEWAHRFIVKGHLRWQPYGHRDAAHAHHLGRMEIDGHGKPVRRCVHEGCDHRVERIYIHPYAKNAHRADLPWIQTEKVYSLER